MSINGTVLPTQVLVGAHDSCYRLCTYPTSFSGSATAELLTLQIRNASNYDQVSLVNVLVGHHGQIFCETKGTGSTRQVSIRTYKYLENNVEKIGVYLYSDQYCYTWELHALSVTSVNLESPITRLGDRNYVPAGELVADSRTGFGCMGEQKVDNKTVATEEQANKNQSTNQKDFYGQISVKSPPASFDLPAAVGDGVTDDTAKIQNIYNKLKYGETLIIPPSHDASGIGKSYIISNLVFNRSEVHIDCQGWLEQKANQDSPAVTIGGYNSTNRIEAKIKLKKSGELKWYKENELGEMELNENNIGVKLLNTNNGTFTFDIANFTQNLVLVGEKLNQSDTGYGGCCYNQIHLIRIVNGQKNIAFQAVNKGYVNENKFYGGQIAWASSITDYDRYQIHIPDPVPFDTVYRINHNVFYSPCLEAVGGGTLIYCEGNRNRFYSPRLEFGSEAIISAYFGVNSFQNHIIYPYCSREITDGSSFINLGKENHLYGTRAIHFNDAQLKMENIQIKGKRTYGNLGFIDVAPKVTKNEDDNLVYNNTEKLWVGKKIVESGNKATSEIITSSIDALGNATFTSLKEETKNIDSIITTENTAGWYRIARSREMVNTNAGIFRIEGTVDSWRTIALIAASCNFGYDPELSILSCSQIPSAAIIKTRIVYSTVYREHLAYIDIYLTAKESRRIIIELLGKQGWILQNPVRVEDEQQTPTKEILLLPGITSLNGFKGKFNPTVKSHTETSGTITLDLSSDSIFKINPTGNIAVNLTNKTVTDNTLREFEIWISQPSSLVQIVWFNGIQWRGGSQPTMQASKTNVFMFRTTDGSSFVGNLEYSY